MHKHTNLSRLDFHRFIKSDFVLRTLLKSLPFYKVTKDHRVLGHNCKLANRNKLNFEYPVVELIHGKFSNIEIMLNFVKCKGTFIGKLHYKKVAALNPLEPHGRAAAYFGNLLS